MEHSVGWGVRIGSPSFLLTMSVALFRLVGENIILMSQALSRKLVIPEFPEFCERLKHVFFKCKKNKEGKVSHAPWGLFLMNET